MHLLSSRSPLDVAAGDGFQFTTPLDRGRVIAESLRGRGSGGTIESRTGFRGESRRTFDVKARRGTFGPEPVS